MDSPMNRLTLTLLVTLILLVSPLTMTLAADAPAPAKAAVATPAPSLCPLNATTLCNGAYLGVNIGTAGVSSDVSAAGVNSSAFTAGGLFGATLGWQYWFNNWFAALEVQADYDSIGTAGGTPGVLVIEYFKVGGLLQNLFTGDPVPSQGPVRVGPFTAVIPYFGAGPAQKWMSTGTFASGWAAGTGVAIPLGGPWTATVDYKHIGFDKTVNPGLTVNSAEILMFGLNRHLW